jgi:hypothetical protein
MAKLMVKIVNAETGEEIEREMNAEELAEHSLFVAAAQADKDILAAKAEAKQAILDKLGITAEEAAALLG